MFLVKFTEFKIQNSSRSIVAMRQHNVWCVYVAFCVERYVGLLAVLCGRYVGLLAVLCAEICWTSCSSVWRDMLDCLQFCVERYVGLLAVLCAEIC